jgi:hypothetical protein
MAGPIGVLTPQQIASNSKIVGYDKQLQMKSLLEDFYTQLEGLYDSVKKTIPKDAMKLKISDAALSDSTEAVITLKLPLNEVGVYGNDAAVGSEERPRTRALTIYRNNLRKPVTTPQYGVRKLDAQGYNLYEQHVDDLAPWNKEHHGLEIRQAVLERFGETLVYGDTASSCTRNWNMNIFVGGLPLREARPTYSSTTATYTTNIVGKINDSGGGAIKVPHVGQTLNGPNLDNLSNFALDRRISPLSIPGLPGGRGYVLTISERQATYLGSPAWSERNMGSYHIQMTGLNEKVMNWPGVIGTYKNFLIVEDVRQPTLDITGTSQPHGLSGGYVWMGDDDQRNREQDTVCDTVFIHGRGSFIEWYPEKIHYAYQLDDYEAIKGVCTALVRGIQTPLYTDENGNNPEQYGSAVGLFRLPEYV